MILAAINTTLSDSADVAQEAAPGDTADALIWHEQVARTGEESRLSISILAFLTIACGLATVGVLTGSPATGDDRAGGRLRLCGGRCGAVPAGRRSHCSQLLVNLAGVVIAAVVVLLSRLRMRARAEHPPRAGR